MFTTKHSLLALCSLCFGLGACVATDPPSLAEDNNDPSNNMVNNPNNNPNNEPNNNPNNTNPDPNNRLPVAAPGLSRQVTILEPVTLDGSASSDPDGDPLTFKWTMLTPEGSSATLSEPTDAITTFTPDLVGDYTLTLVVNDGKANSAAAAVRISAKAAAQPNNPPIADAGNNRSVELGVSVMLDGSASTDPDGDPLTYKWDIPTRPPSSSAMILGDTSATPTFVPDAEGLYLVRLIVNDGKVSGTPATMTLTVTKAAPTNQPPTARAGADRTVEVGTPVTLNGSMSADPDNDPLTYNWTMQKPNGSSSVLQNPMTASPQFTPDVAGAYQLSLTVNDGKVSSAPASVTVTATKNNAAPVANPGQGQLVAVGAMVTLDGAASSDPDGDMLSYKWSLTPPAGSSATLSSTSSRTPSFTADVAGAYAVTLVVNDGQVDSAPQTIIFNADTACLRISEVVEGSSNNKALEVYNCGSGSIDLSGVIFCIHNNDNTACSSVNTFPVVLGADQVYTICHSSSAPMPPTCNTAQGTTIGGGIVSFNGDDRLALYEDLNRDGKVDPTDRLLDAFGELTVRPASTIWADKTYRRCAAAAFNGMGAYNVLSFFQEFPKDDISHLGTKPTLGGCP